MRLIEEEHQFRFIDVAYFRKLVIESREHPQHERTEESWLVLDVLELENAYQSFPLALLHQIMDVELGLTKKRLSSLLLELYHIAQQHTDSRLRHSTICLQLVRAFVRQVRENCAKIREVEQQKPFVIAEFEDQR